MSDQRIILPGPAGSSAPAAPVATATALCMSASPARHMLISRRYSGAVPSSLRYADRQTSRIMNRSCARGYARR